MKELTYYSYGGGCNGFSNLSGSEQTNESFPHGQTCLSSFVASCSIFHLPLWTPSLIYSLKIRISLRGCFVRWSVGSVSFFFSTENDNTARFIFYSFRYFLFLRPPPLSDNIIITFLRKTTTKTLYRKFFQPILFETMPQRKRFF